MNFGLIISNHMKMISVDLKNFNNSQNYITMYTIPKIKATIKHKQKITAYLW